MDKVKTWLLRSKTGTSMPYYGDAHDTPPVIIRAANTFVCLFGAVLLLWHIIPANLPVHVVVAIGGLALAVYLIWTVPRGGQTVLTTAAYWLLLICYALFLPIGG